MSYLTETTTFELDPHSGNGGNNNTTYDYSLPHTKTIDLIGEEFAPKSRNSGNVVVESIGGANLTTGNGNGLGIPTSSHNLGPNVVLVNTSNSGPVPLQVQQILQQTQVSGSHSLSNNIVSVALSQAMGAAGSPQSHQQFALGPSSNGSPAGSVVIHQGPGGTPNEYSFQTSPAGPAGATSVTVDLPSIQQQPAHHGAEGNEVLLCNLDDLSRYIPGGMENFYSDFNMADQHQQSAIISSANLGGVPDYLQTVVAGKAAVTTTVSALPPQLSQSPINLQSHQQLHQQLHQPQTITVHLPTQPQPIQGVKTLTYVSKATNPDLHLGQSNQISHGKITQYAYTPSGERIAITGISPEATKLGSTVQVQVKGGGYQTLQLTAMEPSQAGVKHIVHDGHGHHGDKHDKANSDTIISILEEMKQEDMTVTSASGSMINEANNVVAGMNEYATAIPVSVTSDPKNRTTIKRVAGAQTSTVYLPNNVSSGAVTSGSGNTGAKPRLIFAGNTIPPGAIPIQINGLNAIPITAVKSIPLSTVISPSSTSSSQISNLTTTNSLQSQARKTSSGTSAKATKTGTGSTMVTKVSNNNGGFHKIQSNNLANINKAIGNNKTCNWVFENGEVCGKTFSKSYNLVVHMRMHEDVRPFGCSLCDQTFRQKAHLQRHETTHGIGVKISNRSSTSGGGTNPASGMPRRKRKRSTRGSTGSLTPLTTTHTSTNPGGIPINQAAAAISANLQERLARVSEQFANSNKEGIDEDELEDPDLEESPASKRIRIDQGQCDEASFQPYIATAEEAANAAAAAAGVTPRTSPHILDNALTAAVNEAISTDMM